MATSDGDIEIGKVDSPAVSSDQLHILVVDDSPVNRSLMERLLRVNSCKVTVVDSGLRALQFLGLDDDIDKASVEVDRLKVDMIFTDYSMPGMTGYELLKKIKESTSFREVPVVVMSSEKVKSRMERCLEEGAVEFLLKPVKLADVKRLTEALKTKPDINSVKLLDK